MRWLGRLLLICLLAGGYLYILPLLQGVLPDRSATDNPLLERARSSLVYPLADGKQLTFPVGPQDRQLRLLSNAVVKPGSAIDQKRALRYLIAYQFLDANDRVVKAGEYHLASRLSRFRDTVSGRETDAAFFHPPRGRIADMRTVLFNLEGLEGANRLRLQLQASDQEISDLALRIYRREPQPSRKLALAWQRLSRESKDRLAEATIYSADLLTPDERHNLIKNRWSPLGPLGVKGEDFRIERLYLINDEEREYISEYIPAEGLQIGADRPGTLRLPEGAESLRLSWQVVPGQAAGGEMKLQWWGRPASRYLEKSVALGPAGLLLPSAPGLVQLTPSRSLAIRAWVRLAGREEPLEVTPENRWQRLLLPGEGMLFPVVPTGGGAIPLRLDIRRFAWTAADFLEYSLLDREGAILRGGSLQLPGEASRYDELADAPDTPVSEPSRYFFNLPAAVAGIRLRASPNVAVALYNRPPAAIYRTKVPAPHDGRQINWFPLQPADWSGLQASGRTILVKVQKRPPEVDPLVLAGRYRWQGFIPEGDWRGRYLLLPRDAAMPFREEALASHLHEYPPNREHQVQWSLPSGASRVRPRLHFLRESARPALLRLLLDDVPVLEQEITGHDGALTLPPVAAVKQRLRVEVSGKTRILLSHAPGTQRQYSHRLAARLDERGLDYLVEKQGFGEERLALRFFGDLPHRPHRLQIELLAPHQPAPGPTTEYTNTRRAYLLSPGKAEDTRLLTTAGGEADGGQTFMFPLKGDLKPGQYRLRVRLPQGGKGYLLISRILAGSGGYVRWRRGRIYEHD